MQSEKEEDEREADYWGMGRDVYKEIPVDLTEQPHITPETAL